MKINNDTDYASIWIDLAAEVKLLHHYCLRGNLLEAERCANRVSEFGSRLAIVLGEMNRIPEE